MKIAQTEQYIVSVEDGKINVVEAYRNDGVITIGEGEINLLINILIEAGRVARLSK